VLTDPQVVQLIRDYFIPVAIDKQTFFGARDREAIALANRMTGGRAINLGVHTASPDGDKINTFSAAAQSSSPAAAVSFLRQAMQQVGAAPARPAQNVDLYPNRGVGALADGSVRLAATLRYVVNGHPSKKPVFDSITLSSAEWEAMLPPKTAETRYDVPEEIVRQFSRVVGPESDTSNLLLPQHVTEAHLTGTMSGHGATGTDIVLSGTISASRPYVNDRNKIMPGFARIEGLLKLDAEGHPIRLTMIFNGTFKMPWAGSPSPTTALVEWRLH